MHTLSETWNDFERRILDPIHASQMQRKEMRRAFYAGAQSVLHLIFTQLTPGLEPMDADMALMQSIHDELDAFAERIKAGTA